MFLQQFFFLSLLRSIHFSRSHFFLQFIYSCVYFVDFPLKSFNVRMFVCVWLSLSFVSVFFWSNVDIFNFSLSFCNHSCGVVLASVCPYLFFSCFLYVSLSICVWCVYCRHSYHILAISWCVCVLVRIRSKLYSACLPGRHSGGSQCRLWKFSVVNT